VNFKVNSTSKTNLQDFHPSPVKGIVVLTDTNGATGNDDPYLVASALSDGNIRVWEVQMAARESIS